MSVVENLTAALDRLRHVGWIKGEYHEMALRADGTRSISGYCAAGAVCDSLPEMEPIDYSRWLIDALTRHTPEFHVLAQAIGRTYPDFVLPGRLVADQFVAGFNDHPHTTWGHIETVFTTAIALSREQDEELR